MHSSLLPFTKMAWQQTGVGIAEKSVVRGDRNIRLVRFDDTFHEAGWCTRQHTGFVLQGSLTIDINGTLETYHTGDGFFLAAEPECRHKVTMPAGQTAEVLLIDPV